MKKFLKKLVTNEWYPLALPLVVFIATLVATGLGVAFLMAHFILYSTALISDWFPKKLE